MDHEGSTWSGMHWLIELFQLDHWIVAMGRIKYDYDAFEKGQWAIWSLRMLPLSIKGPQSNVDSIHSGREVSKISSFSESACLLVCLAVPTIRTQKYCIPGDGYLIYLSTYSPPRAPFLSSFSMDHPYTERTQLDIEHRSMTWLPLGTNWDELSAGLVSRETVAQDIQ